MANKRTLRKWEKRSYIATTLMLLVALLGVCYVKIELQALREQNKIVNRSFRETFRPIGIVEPISYFSKDTTSFFKTVTLLDSTEGLAGKRVFTNEGKGILYYIGYFSFSVDSILDFSYKSLLQNIKEQKIDTSKIKQDTRPRTKRLEPLQIGKNREFEIVWKTPIREGEYYLYCAFFYKNQDNILFDTIYLTQYKIYKGSTNIVIENQFFHEYSKEEHNELYDIIKLHNKSLAFGIGKIE